jgi:DNA-binding MarR family transcriptional regulator
MATSRAAAASSAAEDLLTIVPRLNRWAEASITSTQSEVKLSLRQLSALMMIEDEITTLGDVAKRLNVTPAVVTGLIDRLERRGYVQRMTSTDDRRRVMLSLTDNGRAALETATRNLASELERSLLKLPADDLQTINKALERLAPVASELESK